MVRRSKLISNKTMTSKMVPTALGVQVPTSDLRASESRADSSGRKKAHKHKLFVLVNVQMALGQTAGCPRVNRAKKLMCSPRNTGNISFSLWLTGGLSQGCPDFDFQKVYVFKVYVPFSRPIRGVPNTLEEGIRVRFCCLLS